MGRRVLLISVKFMSLYQDIIRELENQGYDVSFLEDVNFNRNYYNLHRRGNQYFHVFQGKYNRYYWQKKIKENKIDYRFDYLLCIDGFSLINSGFIDFLETYNPSIKKILYLFDRTYQNYRFDLLFSKFDKIYSFDLKDCKEYGLNVLPIYWIPCDNSDKIYDIFGFGTYMKNRFQLFKYVDAISQEKGLNSFIKLYLPEKKESIISKIRDKIRGNSIPKEVYSSPLLTHSTMPPYKFREYLGSSHIVLDTHDILQDGLTARFMWALGSGANIITTNKAARKYPFYNDKKILIVDLNNLKLKPEIFDYNESGGYLPSLINQYRIDNWIKTIMS